MNLSLGLHDESTVLASGKRVDTFTLRFHALQHVDMGRHVARRGPNKRAGYAQ